VSRGCEIVIDAFPLGRRTLQIASFAQNAGQGGSWVHTEEDAIYPHPFSMSFHQTDILKTFEIRREGKGSTRLAARNRKKTATVLDFRKFGRWALTPACPKVLTQFTDSHFCHMRQKPEMSKTKQRSKQKAARRIPR
jgi:hypothetical protein